LAARAGEQENVRELVRLVGVVDRESWKTAPSLFASVPAESTLHPTAVQAMAIIHLQQGQFSQAWKLLSTLSNRLQTTPVSFRLGYEKLMLWLWLEAESVSNAEAQFKRLVTLLYAHKHNKSNEYLLAQTSTETLESIQFIDSPDVESFEHLAKLKSLRTVIIPASVSRKMMAELTSRLPNIDIKKQK
jgi:hypothetical protein